MSELCRTMFVIKQWFDASGMTQSEFASKVGVSRVTVNRWLNGSQIPDLYHVEKMMEVFGLKQITIRQDV